MNSSPSSGIGCPPSSSRVRSIALTSFEPPASDITSAFVAGVGDTSRMSMSSGQLCDRPLIFTFTSVIDPVSPETTQADG